MADYIGRDEAIAALREFAEDCKGSTEAATAAAMAISVISRMPGPWVDANIELPLSGERVLTYCKYGHIRDRMLSAPSSRPSYFRPDGMKPGKDILYWMPMPDKPGEE